MPLKPFESIAAFFRPAPTTIEGAACSSSTTRSCSPAQLLQATEKKQVKPIQKKQMQPTKKKSKLVLGRPYNARAGGHSATSSATVIDLAETPAYTEPREVYDTSFCDTPIEPAECAESNKSSSQENNSATTWHGRLHHKSSRRFLAFKNALLHRHDYPPVPQIQQTQNRTVSDSSATSSTVDSENTVCRRPSRREDSPIAMHTRNLSDEDTLPGTSTDKLSIPKGRPMPEFSFREYSGITQKSGCSEYTPPALCSLPNYMLHQRLFSNMGSQNRQEKAFGDFNQLAEFHHFYTLIPPEHDPINMQEQPKLSTKKSIIHKVRSMRSGLLRGQQGHGLRRVKTFTGLAGQFHGMDSLKGKSLETLARLGGYSVLTFPGDFVPALMRLPACLVSMIDYLRLHSPKSRNVFFEPGDLTVAARVYDHFASQVLSVEKEEMVDMTMRKSDFPSEALGPGEESFLRGRFHVLPVAWAFKQVLAGIPGGILGSPRLYLTLVDLSTRIFPDEPPELPAGYSYWAMPAMSQTRVRAIALAILALTSDMQLDLICAVFGLCSLLDYATSQLMEEFQASNVPMEAWAAGLLTRRRIVQAFAPLLAGDLVKVEANDFESEAFFVMSVVMVNWRAVSRQLRAFDG